MHLGCCYYPEQWPKDRWADDAARMAAMGLRRVRIGEFAWSRIEPEPGRFDWGWLDRAVETLHQAALGIIMGTPTATPPKWLVDAMPDMIAIDTAGRPRRFGSRRHYCFSHSGYLAEAARITAAMAERYGRHPAVVMWQTDNEYGCHDSVMSYSAAALAGFRRWLEVRYGTIDALNTAWGNVFWSMDYRAFHEIELPNLTVTEANPAHRLAFRRYSSDRIAAFNAAQVDILRAHSPERDITHNFMGFFTEFDHHAVGAQIDLASWDSYPLGFLEQFRFSDSDKQAYARQGHPDIAAFHHDLYRGCSGGRWGVMEQQPGPVNWARYNPAPLPGMVRLWTLEALAHGAELVSYFRWRQAPFAQEQMHAGLLRPDSVEAPAADEVRAAARDIAELGPSGAPPRSIALLFDYQADWVTGIQPQGAGQSALWAAFDWYSALRQLGFDIDILAPTAALDGYAMVVIPCLPIVDDALVDRLTVFAGPVVIGPRSGSKTGDCTIPTDLPPGPLQRLIPVKVARVSSLRPGVTEAGTFADGAGWTIGSWIEDIESHAIVEWATGAGRPVVLIHDRVRYVTAQPDAVLLGRLLEHVAREAGLVPMELAPGVRVRRNGNRLFVVNYTDETRPCPTVAGMTHRLGGPLLDPAGVAVLQAD
jgi:beta-galactosidase